MTPLQFNQRHYLIDGKAIYLNSGEFHYFRVPRADWKKRMELFKEAGGNCLATYSPWLIHEPEEGRFDFGQSNPQLDLEAFLGTANDMGLYVVCRPGPYQYSELVANGLPLWLTRDYPEVRAVNRKGQFLTDGYRCDQVSYLHPVFLEKVKRWYAKVCPIIARHSVHRGGPVAFVQPDNEMAGIQVWNGGHDYHPDTMGFGNADGRYPRFLERKYGSLDNLNNVYGSAFPAFAQVDPRSYAAVKMSYMLEKDYFAFYCEHLAEYFSFLVAEMERHGIDVPFVHNAANPNMNSYFLESVERLRPKLLLGSDHYYNLNLHWEQNNPTPQYAVKAFCSLEMLRLMGFPPTVFELPGGSTSDWPPMTPQDLHACYLTNIAYGMKGHNYYILTGGPNVAGTGYTSDVYDFCAPIGPRGEIRETYPTVKEFGLFMKANSWLVEAEREADFQVAMPWEYTRARNYATPCAQLAESAEETWTFVRDGLLISSFCAGLSPVFCDLNRVEGIDLSKPIYVPACSYLEQDRQEKIVELLKAGATVVMGPTMPLLDETLKPCRILAGFLGLDAAGFTIGRRIARSMALPQRSSG
jgi:beta-galactosidase